MFVFVGLYRGDLHCSMWKLSHQHLLKYPGESQSHGHTLTNKHSSQCFGGLVFLCWCLPCRNTRTCVSLSEGRSRTTPAVCGGVGSCSWVWESWETLLHMDSLQRRSSLLWAVCLSSVNHNTVCQVFYSLNGV